DPLTITRNNANSANTIPKAVMALNKPPVSIDDIVLIADANITTDVARANKDIELVPIFPPHLDIAIMDKDKVAMIPTSPPKPTARSLRFILDRILRDPAIIRVADANAIIDTDALIPPVKFSFCIAIIPIAKTAIDPTNADSPFAMFATDIPSIILRDTANTPTAAAIRSRFLYLTFSWKDCNAPLKSPNTPETVPVMFSRLPLMSVMKFEIL